MLEGISAMGKNKQIMRRGSGALSRCKNFKYGGLGSPHCKGDI